MRVGIDLQLVRWTPAGLYSYIRHLLEWLPRLPDPCEVVPFLYGHAGIEEPKTISRLRGELGGLPVRYSWDGFAPKLLSNFFGGLSSSPWAARQIDRRLLMPLWRAAVSLTSHLCGTAWRRGAAWREVDVFHHVGLVTFPSRAKANVMTVPDLSPLRVPECHPGQASYRWWKESFGQAQFMDSLLTYSEHTKQEIVEHLGINGDAIRVAPLAAHEQYRPIEDRDEVQAVLRQYGLGERPFVLHVGTLEPRKNLPRLVEAFHRLQCEDRHLEHRLVLVGGKGWMYEPIFDAIRAFGLEDEVRWLDHVPFEHLPALMTGAELFVYPSLYEGFGLPPLEAMSCGTPVVASRISSLPEVVGDAGLLVDPEGVEGIAAAIHRVLTDRGLRNEFRAKGLARARAFSWERTAQLTRAAYAEALGRAGPRGRRAQAPAATNFQKWMRQWVINETLRHL